jgi:ketosteroid isomerase-like protein
MRASVLSGFILSLTLLVASPLVLAQSADEAAVAKAVEAFRNAVIAKDKGQLEALLADQLHYWHTDGRVETKSEHIADVLSKRALYKSIDLTNQIVKVTGDTAIVRHNLSAESEREGGKMQSTRVGVFMVWQKQGGSWKLVARQAIPFQKVAGAS